MNNGATLSASVALDFGDDEVTKTLVTAGTSAGAWTSNRPRPARRLAAGCARPIAVGGQDRRRVLDGAPPVAALMTGSNHRQPAP